MRLIPVKCQACGSDLQVPQDMQVFYCIYCGSRFILDDGAKKFTYRSIDEARIHEADVHERLELRKLEQAAEMRKIKLRVTPFIVAGSLFMMLIGVFAMSVTGDSNNPWGLFGMIGFLGLLAVALIWIPWNQEEKKKEEKVDSAWEEAIRRFARKFF